MDTYDTTLILGYDLDAPALGSLSKPFMGPFECVSIRIKLRSSHEQPPRTIQSYHPRSEHHGFMLDA